MEDEIILFLMMILLAVTEVVVVHKVAKGLRGNGDHVGQDHSAVAAGCKKQLVMGVVISHAPHPKTTTRTKTTLKIIGGKKTHHILQTGILMY